MPLGSAFHATLYMGGGGAGGGSAPAGAWTVANATYASKSLAVGTQETQPQAMYFKDDGTKVYVLGLTSDRVFQYSLSTAWDISTATYDNVSSSTLSQEAASRGLFFKTDGTKFYFVGNGSDTVYQYSCSTAWSVSSTSYDSKSFSVTSQDTSPADIFFKPDGTKFYIMGQTNDTVYQYSMSTAWDVSTASYDTKSFSVTTQESTPTALFFKDDGTRMWTAGSTNNTVYQYNLSTAWDVSTASYASISKSISAQDSPRAVFFKPNGNAMWQLGATGTSIYQYTLS
jgi:DNA-binding beta-propeller fold protein YncE